MVSETLHSAAAEPPVQFESRKQRGVLTIEKPQVVTLRSVTQHCTSQCVRNVAYYMIVLLMSNIDGDSPQVTQCPARRCTDR
jgi:hypothetical protein